eukprot:Plantae.Rhodophyta-Palmaria_palmata.ctg12537.p1 GENE.Plantae.Rhodophyta-Palmaria_palmata.ctg12537~~Plantae.Rhodophyta-Palmaria_palmata.ctg12537.p1  ORF type:complete len:205 (-),score=24.06 Plantae.Rhodophyta-Palmaria_palmata.ctg12537:92-643(-)
MGASDGRGGGLRTFEDTGSSQSIDDIISAVADDGKFEEEAKALLLSWNSHVLRLMDDFGVETEAELISGQVSSFGVHHNNHFRSGEHNNLLMQMNRQVRELRSEFREEFWSDDGLIDSSNSFQEGAYQKAACWYKVCQAEKNRVLASESAFAIHSFPWCVRDVLCQLFIAHLPPVNEDWHIRK